MRRLELADNETELCIRFPYDEALLPVVRGLPRRRFDRDQKAWFCPRDEVVAAVDALKDLRFEVTEEVLGLYRESGGTWAGTGAATPAPAKAGGRTLWSDPKPTASEAPSADSLTVSELNGKVHRALRQAFPAEVWLVGELTGFDRNKHRNHVWFELAEKDGEGDSADVKATVSAVLFESTRARVEQRLADAQAPFELADGIQVRVKVKVDLYQPRGTFQVVVEDIDPIHTLGRLAQNRARILAEIEKLGLTETNRRLPWPLVPLRVGLITSPGSDAYNDFVNELTRSGLAFQVTSVPARMQGPSLEKELLRALDWFEQRAEDFDVLTVVRGGGARTDLMWFDSLPLALKVARCPLKILSGIGHHRDVSVVDLLVHAEKTPTAAAQALVERVTHYETRLRQAARRLPEQVAVLRRAQRARLLRVGTELARNVTRLLRERQRERLRLAHAVGTQTRTFLRHQQRRLDQGAMRFVDRGRVRLVLAGRMLGSLRRRFTVKAFAATFQGHRRQLKSLAAQARSLHPDSVLRRGFAWLKDDQGRTVRRIQQVQPGQALEARLADGTLSTRVETVEPSAGSATAPLPDES